MERFINVAFVHFTITAGSMLSYRALGDGDWEVLRFALQTCARFITIPGRQIGVLLLPEGSAWLWLAMAGNSLLWASVLVWLWSLIEARRKT
jgi:hypothetical protein